MSELESLDKEFNSLLERIQVVANRRRELRGFEKRNSLHPIISEREQRSFDFYHTQQRALWVPHEMKFSEDINDYNSLSEDLKRFIDIPFGFFSGADSDVIDMLAIRFLLEPDSYHELCYYLAQLYIESVHAETYALSITHLITDKEKREALLNAVKGDPVVKEIHVWMDKFLAGNFTDTERKAATALMEGAIFQVPFLFIFYFKTNGKMKNIRFINEQISKDEGLHADKGCNVVKHWRLENGRGLDDKIYALAEEARQLARKFSLYVLTRKDGTKIEVSGLNEKAVLAYCDLVTNTVLYRFGMQQVYDVNKEDIPDWMSSIADTLKANFYENSIGNYAQFSQADLGEDDSDSDVDF